MPGRESDRVEAVQPHLSDLIDGIKPQFLVDLLKDNEETASTVLRGFRPTAQSVRSHIVKQRLIAEAEKNPSFSELLGIAWIDSNRNLWGHIALGSAKELKSSLDDLANEFGPAPLRIALLMDDRRTIRQLADKIDMEIVASKTSRNADPIREKKPATQKASNDNHVEENRLLNGKIKALEKQVRELELHVDKHHRDLERDESELQTTKYQLADLKKRSDKAEKTADRLRRAKETAESEKLFAERELKHARRDIQNLIARNSAESRAQKPAAPHNPDWVPIISNMLKDGHYQAAQTFCEAVKASAPENLHARLVLEHVYAKLEAKDKQLNESLWVAAYMNKRGQPIRACAFVCRALEVKPSSRDAQSQFKSVLERIKTSDDSAVSAVRRLVGRLKSASPTAYRETRRIVRVMGGQWLRILEGQSESLHPDKIFDLSDGKRTVQVSIRRITEAVDGNETSLVVFVRRALSKLRTANPALYRSIVESLDAYDRSCMSTLTRGTHPVIVDGSNVAWHETGEKPRLQNILDLRSELRSEGYFPVYIYVDAALQHQVDQQSTLLQLIEEGAVVATPSRTDADEEITEQARMLSCPVVTNDRMADWDPYGEIPKVRFTIDRFGITLYER